MGRRRRIALLALCVASATLVVGSGAFTSTSAERPVSVDVVGDDEAYMSLVYTDTTQVTVDDTNGTVTHEYLTVQNRFGQQVTIDVNASADAGEGLAVTPYERTIDLDTGEETKLEAEFNCTAPGDHEAEISFGVTATGEGITAETGQDRTVTFDVSCPADETTTTTDE